MVKLLSILATIVFIPLRSKQHFIPLGEINECALADICNHTWITECGFYEEKSHTRVFIDECDMHEYNCDNNMSYAFTNYSQCFGSGAVTCPYVPSLLTRVQGFYIYYADGRRMMRYLQPEKKKRAKTTYYTLPRLATTKTTRDTQTTLWKDRRRYTPWKTGSYKPWTDETAPCGRQKIYLPDTPRPTLYQYWPPLESLEMFARTPGKKAKKPKKPTTKRTTKRTTAKPTTQVVKTGTIGTVILNKATVWKDGKLVYKVIKGYKKPPVITTYLDSDFLA